MKRKRFSAVLGCLLAFAILAGIAIPFASAANETITFLSPLGKIEPLDNQPLAEREWTDFNDKTVLLLYFGVACNAEVCQSLEELLKAEYPGVTVLRQGAGGIPALGDPYDAKPAATYDAWAKAADAVIMGVADENCGAWWMSSYAKELEARGVPVVVVANSPFEQVVRNGAADNGFTGLRMAVIDHKWYSQSYGRATTGTPTARFTFIKDNVVAKTNLDDKLPDRGTVYEQVKMALTTSLSDEEKNPSPIDPKDLGDIGVDTLTVEGATYAKAVQKFQDLSMEMNFGDGLPLVIPTGKLVDNMLSGTTRDRNEVIGKIMLGGGIITVEKVAINAVMAGARPEHFPVILAAMEAYASAWEDGKMFYHATSSSDQMTLMLLISGPIADELNVAQDRAFGASGFESNNIIGHAVRLCIRNIGHNLTQDTAANLGRASDHAMIVFSEETSRLPDGWKTHSEMMGFPAGSSTVTLQAVGGARAFTGYGEPSMAFTPTSILTTMRNLVGTNATVVVLTPANAEVIASPTPAPGMDLTTKEAVQSNLSSANPKLVWPIVAGGDPSQSRVFNGGIFSYGVRAYQTQLITGATYTEAGKDATAPSTPQDFNVTVSGSGKSATLTWTAPISDGGSQITKYQVSNTDGVTWTDVPADAMSYTFAGLTPGTQYYFRVRAVNGATNAAEIARIGNAYSVVNSASGRGAWACEMCRPERTPPTSMKIDGATLVTIRKNATTQLAVTVAPANADNTVVWSSTNPAIVSVDTNGLATAVATGTAVITAKTPDGAIASTVTLRVTA